MKNLITLLLVALSYFGHSQIINFPDPNFKNALVNTKCANIGIVSAFWVNPDTNKDGEIQISEADKIVRLNISYQSVSNIQGLEFFKNLIRLEIEGNNLDSINFMEHPTLEYLDINQNKTKYLNLNNLHRLKSVIFSNNPIKKENIYLSNLDSLSSITCVNTLIDTFSFIAPNITNIYTTSLTHLETHKYKSLKTLTCAEYKGKILDLRSLKELEFINCEQSKVEKLKVSGLNKMKHIRCFSNQIDSIDLRGMDRLTELNCSNNMLTALNFSDCKALITVSCSSNKLKSLDLSQCYKLEKLSCYYNQIEFLSTRNGVKEKNITIHNIPLKYLCCDDSEIQFYANYFASTSTLGNYQIGTYCSFTPGGKFYIINGNNNFDITGNGCTDQSKNIPFLKMNVTSESNAGSIISVFTENFQIPLQANSYSIKPLLENQSHFEVTPSSFAFTFPFTSDTITQNFCITPKGIFRQTNITVIPLTPPARPGFEAQYKIVWENAGNQIESGTLNFTYNEALLDYISASQVADIVADGIVKWNFSDLRPFEKREIVVALRLNRPTDTPAVNSGDKLYLTASILDNIFTLENTVVGSYDPNDKTCLQGDRIHPDQIGKYVDFLIRFENTGNYAAENVVVKDIIDTKTFDVSSLQITDASHEVYARIEGNKVEFIFEKIQLPFDDATNDGYIAFKIKTLPTLMVGDSLKNLADIYFDYNFPIRTNETKSKLAFPVGTDDIETEVNVYPNPVSNILTLEIQDDIIHKVEIYDIQGRIMRSSFIINNQLNVSDLEQGSYVSKVYGQKGIGWVRFVKI